MARVNNPQPDPLRSLAAGAADGSPWPLTGLCRDDRATARSVESGPGKKLFLLRRMVAMVALVYNAIPTFPACFGIAIGARSFDRSKLDANEGTLKPWS
jgi:hypothetical protein